MNQTSIFILMLLFICSSCKKEEDPCIKYNKELPPITTSGQYTFGCKMNGENWVVNTDQFQQFIGGGAKKITCSISTADDLFISGSLKYNNECDEIDQFLSFNSLGIELGENIISENGKLLDWENECRYKIDSNHLHFVEIIHFDKEKKIVSGKFNFTLISKDCLDTLTISDGRFDTTY